MEKRNYNPYIMGKMVFDLNEKRIPAIEDSLNSMSTRVTALETPKALSSTPFETGETYKGKPVKKVAIPLNNANSISIGSSYVDLGIGIGDLPIDTVLNSSIVSRYNIVGGISFSFNPAILSGGHITAAANPSVNIASNAELVIEYIEKDPAEVSSN